MSARGPTRMPPASPRVAVWPTRRRRARPLLPQVLELIVIVSFLLISYHGLLWYWEWTAPKEVTVAKVVGMTEQEAAKVLTSAGLRPEVATHRSSEEVPEGQVLSADPPPGRKVKAGRKVQLTISSGSRWSLVPDVREMSVDRARALLYQDNLEVGKETARYHGKVPVGYVISQVPPPDQKVPRGTEVDLLVSKGPTPRIEPPEREEGAGARQTRVEYEVPPGASLQEVRIVVEDRRGERTVYRNFHRPGEKVVETVTGEGPGAVVRVYVSGILAEEKPI